jgi:hypothetical protein
MKKLYLFMFIVAANITLASAQRGDCGLPTCEEPGDPGLVEIKKTKEINVYPNPSRGKISIELKEDRQSKIPVMLTDLAGKVIVREFVEPKQALSFDLANQAAGLYIVKVITDNGIKSAKVLIQR